MSWLRRLLDRLCPYVPRGERAPYGFSRTESHFADRSVTLQLMLPIALWYGTGYCVATDTIRRGWWTLKFRVAFKREYGGFSVHAHHWSTPRGWGLVKFQKDDVWIDEREYYGRSRG